MTVMVGKLTSIGGQPFGGEGHAVKIFSRVTRTSPEDEAVILQLIDRIDMPSVEDGGDGTFTTVDMDPGPIRVELEGSSRHGEGWDINLPETDPEDPRPWSLGSLIGLEVEWPPVVVGRAQQFAREAGEHATTAQEIATNLPATIQNELDDRVPEALSTDQTIRDAATLAVNDAVDAGLPGKADTSYVDAQDQALGQRITDEKWYRGGLGSSDNLDDYQGRISIQGLYRVTTAVGGGTGLAGWVEVTYDGNSARTRQVFTASSPSESVSLERKYSGGYWRDWSPVTWHGVVISSGSADDLLTPHVYAINATGIAELPAPLLGSLETLPAGSDWLTLTQIFTSSESTPRTWKRTRRAGQWNEWVQLTTMQDVHAIVDEALSDFEVPDPSPPPMVLDATETPISSGARIVASMTQDGKVGYNNLAPTLNQSFDNGVTWERVRTFGGQYVEWCEPLPTGELMVCTNGTVDGKSGRHIWVSAGYDRDNPTAATWEITKQNPFGEVKYANWSFYAHENRVLLADYGPKSGMSWGSLNPVPEGENARYVYQSMDGGYTWETIFDLNDFLLSNGRTTADRQHLHGVAWDQWWGRIWVTFGDASGGGTNGVLYSDDEGATWQAAYWTHTHTSQGWQVVGIQPMQDVVLFAGDMTPSGLIALDRSEGRDAFNFYTAWDFSETEKHLCHVIRYSSGPLGEIAMFAFAREGSASPSFIVGTRDGREFVVLWQESGTSLPGIKTLAGPSADGTVIASNSTSAGWVEVSGRLHVTGSPWQADTKAELATLDTRIPKTLALRRDTSVGTRIMAGDTMIYGDTGWRTLWDPSTTSAMDSGRIVASRVGNFVTLVFDQCIFNVEHPALKAIPDGFRGPPFERAIQLYSGAWLSPDGTGRVSAAGWLNLYRAPVGTPIFGQVTYPTREAWPTTLPGTPA